MHQEPRDIKKYLTSEQGFSAYDLCFPCSIEVNYLSGKNIVSNDMFPRRSKCSPFQLGY